MYTFGSSYAPDTHFTISSCSYKARPHPHPLIPHTWWSNHVTKHWIVVVTLWDIWWLYSISFIHHGSLIHKVTPTMVTWDNCCCAYCNSQLKSGVYMWLCISGDPFDSLGHHSRRIQVSVPSPEWQIMMPFLGTWDNTCVCISWPCWPSAAVHFVAQTPVWVYAVVSLHSIWCLPSPTTQQQLGCHLHPFIVGIIDLCLSPSLSDSTFLASLTHL